MRSNRSQKQHEVVKMLTYFTLINLFPVIFSQFYFGTSQYTYGESLFPEISFRAFKPRGFEITIHKRADILEIIDFTYQINKGVLRTPRWENYLQELKYFEPQQTIKVGDLISYTVTIVSNRFEPTKGFIDYRNFAFRFNFATQRYTYTDIKIINITVLESICDYQALNQNCNEETPIFQDDFSNSTLNTDIWNVEHYIPLCSEENFEFVSYQNIPDCVFTYDSKLYLKPIVVTNSRLQGTLDLRQKCTRNLTQACFYSKIGAHYLPPVTSGKIVSKFTFKYGKVEIKAKLPIGDWIFPQIELIPEDLTKKYPKFLIAYSRGNKKLITKEGKEIGSNMLYGGYLKSSDSMKSVDELRSIHLGGNLRENVNVFSLTWTPDKIVLSINDDVYSTTYQSINDGKYRIALGVGVGGNFDFPDDSKSGNYIKPWKNDAVKQVKEFLDSKNNWTTSWVNNDVALQVDYIKVYAV